MKPKVSWKPRFSGRNSGAASQVPLADPAGSIACFRQIFRQGRLRQWQSLAVIAGMIVGISLVAETHLVAARQQRRPRWTAIGMCHVPAGATHALAPAGQDAASARPWSLENRHRRNLGRRRESPRCWAWAPTSTSVRNGSAHAKKIRTLRADRFICGSNSSK